MDPELHPHFPALLSSCVTLGKFLKTFSPFVSSLVRWGTIECTLESELSWYMESACVVLETNKHYQVISNIYSDDPFRISYRV